MKKVLTFLLTILTAVSAIAADSLTVFYRIRLDQDIDQSSQRLVTLGLEKAREADADYVLLDLNTYGGAVDAADSIRSAILRYEKDPANQCRVHRGHGEAQRPIVNCHLGGTWGFPKTQRM